MNSDSPTPKFSSGAVRMAVEGANLQGRFLRFNLMQIFQGFHRTNVSSRSSLNMPVNLQTQLTIHNNKNHSQYSLQIQTQRENTSKSSNSSIPLNYLVGINSAKFKIDVHPTSFSLQILDAQTCMGNKLKGQWNNIKQERFHKGRIESMNTHTQIHIIYIYTYMKVQIT